MKLKCPLSTNYEITGSNSENFMLLVTKVHPFQHSYNTLS